MQAPAYVCIIALSVLVAVEIELAKGKISGLKFGKPSAAAVNALALMSLSVSLLGWPPCMAAPSPATSITKIPGQKEGLTSQQQEHINQLQDSLQKARKGGEAESDALYQLGQYYFSISDPVKAESYFRQSLAVEDKLHRQDQSLQVRIALAHLMMSQKRSS